MAAGQKKPEAQWTANERKATNLDQRLKSLIMSMLPDDQINSVINCLTAKSTWDDLILCHEGFLIPDDEEDTRSGHEYLNYLEEEYQDFEAKYHKVKAKLAFLSSSALTPSSSSSKNKGLVVEMCDWDNEEVSSDEDEVTEVKALMALTDEERVLVAKECSRMLLVLKQAKLNLLTMHHVNTEILKENQNLRLELKELTSITETWLNNSNKVNQCINEQVPTQKKKILGIDQLTEDTSSFGSKDSVFVKSSADNSDMSITSSNIPKSSKTEDSTLPSHDTGEVPSNESQRNTTDPSVVISDSSATNYDSTDGSLVCSTPLISLKKLDGVEPVSGPKTIKLILKLKSTFKAKTLKDDPPLAIVMKELNELKLQISKKKSSYSRNKNAQQGLTYKGYSDSDYAERNMKKEKYFRYLYVSKKGKLVDKVAMFLTKTKDIDDAGCCANILWI
nr:hypothetical protein [Tanacetum cinerariifolium]